MSHKHNNPQDSDYAFEPPSFLFYYWQRIFIWGEWSIAQARYYHRRDLQRYKEYLARRQTNTDNDSKEV